MKLQDLNEIMLGNAYSIDIGEPEIMGKLIEARDKNNQYIEYFNTMIDRKRKRFVKKNLKQPEYLIINEHDFFEFRLFQHLFQEDISGFKLYHNLKVISSPELSEGEILVL